MQPPAPQATQPAANMYHPPQQAMMGGGLFSLHKFLMIGVILILIAGLISVLLTFQDLLHWWIILKIFKIELKSLQKIKNLITILSD